jgi:RNA recognition motif-containing protein
MTNRSNASTPPAKEPAKDAPSKANGAPPNAASTEKAEKEKQKRKEKKDRKDREKAEREAKEADEVKDGSAPAPAAAAEPSTPAQVPKSGKATPTSNPPEASTSAADLDSELKSPATESTGGARTPISKRGQKNPWTIFMRMSVTVTESELREFFGEAKEGIIRINLPQPYSGRAKIAYVEFGDEEAMKAGLEKHAEVRIYSVSSWGMSLTKSLHRN